MDASAEKDATVWSRTICWWWWYGIGGCIRSQDEGKSTFAYERERAIEREWEGLHFPHICTAWWMHFFSLPMHLRRWWGKESGGEVLFTLIFLVFVRNSWSTQRERRGAKGGGFDAGLSVSFFCCCCLLPVASFSLQRPFFIYFRYFRARAEAIKVHLRALSACLHRWCCTCCFFYFSVLHTSILRLSVLCVGCVCVWIDFHARNLGLVSCAWRPRALGSHFRLIALWRCIFMHSASAPAPAAAGSDGAVRKCNN